jgi:hypothetical protein
MRHRYTGAELADFEHTMGIRLPTAYRFYLRLFGWADPMRGGLSSLEDWCQPCSPEDLPTDFLRQPFPFTEAWNDLTQLDPDAGWAAPYFDDMYFRGAMRIKNLGCEGYHLLVVSGPERGTVWADERGNASLGVYPLRRWGQRRVGIGRYLAGLY